MAKPLEIWNPNPHTAHANDDHFWFNAHLLLFRDNHYSITSLSLIFTTSYCSGKFLCFLSSFNGCLKCLVIYLFVLVLTCYPMWSWLIFFFSFFLILVLKFLHFLFNFISCYSDTCPWLFLVASERIYFLKFLSYIKIKWEAVYRKWSPIYSEKFKKKMSQRKQTLFILSRGCHDAVSRCPICQWQLIANA